LITHVGFRQFPIFCPSHDLLTSYLCSFLLVPFLLPSTHPPFLFSIFAAGYRPVAHLISIFSLAIYLPYPVLHLSLYHQTTQETSAFLHFLGRRHESLSYQYVCLIVVLGCLILIYVPEMAHDYNYFNDLYSVETNVGNLNSSIGKKHIVRVELIFCKLVFENY